MGYEIYKREVVRVSTPAITLNKRGRLVFNVSATKKLNDMGVENAFLLWDKDHRRFAIRPTSKKDERAVKVRFAAKRKWAAISAKGFLEHIGHDLTKTVSLPAVWNDTESMFEVSMPEGQEELPGLISQPKRKSNAQPEKQHVER